MTITEMLGQSGILTLIGMGIVFLFLTVMIMAVSLTGKLFRVADKNTQPACCAAGETAGNNNEVTAAIGAAVNEYRSKTA